MSDAPQSGWFARRPVRHLAAVGAGASLVLAFAPFGWAWLAPLPLCALLLLLEGRSPRSAGLTGWLFGLGLFAAGTWWLYISLNILGGLWPPFALLLMGCLVAATAAFVAAGAWLTALVAASAPAWVRGLGVFPAAWVLAEWCRGWMVTGFPWLSVGYGQVETPLGAVAPLAGVYGVSWITLLVAGCLYTAVRGDARGRVLALVAAALVVAGLWSVQDRSYTRDTGRDFRVGLVQGAVPQERKWLPEQLQPTLDLYRDLSLAMSPRDLIVWPEAAIPALPFEVRDYIDQLHEDMVSRDTQLFTGILFYRIEEGQFLNTLWALGEEQGTYFKRHLVMFGEYFPLPDFARRWLRIMNLPSESITPGSDDQPLLLAKGVPVAATICYELAFGAEQLGFLPEAQLLVNVSNDAWFGESMMPQQHLQIGQMRALETGRYLLRATNTGITAIVDPAGRVVSRIPQFEPGVIEATVRPHTGATPYVLAGNWPVLVLVASILLAGALVYPSRPRN